MNRSIIRRIVFSALFLLTFSSHASAQDGHRIEVRIEGYKESELYLAYYYGDKQYIADTANVNDNKSFVFKGDEPLPAGIYLVVTKPDNNYFEILIDENEQNFSVRTKMEDLTTNIELYGEAPNNRVFQTWLKFLVEPRKAIEELNLQKEGANESQLKNIDAELLQLEKNVADKQDEIIDANPGSLVALLLATQKNIEIPEFTGSEEEIQTKQFYYYRDHFFDNLDIGDSRLLYTPVLFNKINQYETTLTVQNPDSLITAIDLILNKMNPSGENFKFFLIHFLNKYAKSLVVGFDAVYVHLVNNYYAKGLAPWTDQEKLEEILDSGKALEPLLIGKIAPDFSLEGQYGAEVSLHKFDAKYTVLYFWRKTCGQCVKQIPDLKKVYEKYAKDGLKVFTISTSVGDDVKEDRKFIEDNNLTMWTNAAHPYQIGKVMQLYDIKSTPQIYLLDKDKKILSKRIGADQLEGVLDYIIKADTN
ncbi:MAG: hypothetical protein SCALA702_36950 [Melioribacteraceae bacterium]|nr:MAG: hypothetical protein SCALA702_36950 [Melioribacteraceae bacterium]